MINLVKDICMLFVSIATYVSFIPQIIKLIRTKKSDDLSFSSWLIWWLSSLAYLIFSLLEGGFGLIFSSLSEMILTAIVFGLSIKYRKMKE